MKQDEFKDKKLGKYRHYKGGEYILEAIATHSDTLVQMCIYRAIYGEKSLWVKEARFFFDELEYEGKRVVRFTYLGE